jgi:hypothetical protein
MCVVWSEGEVVGVGSSECPRFAARLNHGDRLWMALAEVYFGRQYAVLSERPKIKRRAMQKRRQEYLAEKAAGLQHRYAWQEAA